MVLFNFSPLSPTTNVNTQVTNANQYTTSSYWNYNVSPIITNEANYIINSAGSSIATKKEASSSPSSAYALTPTQSIIPSLTTTASTPSDSFSLFGMSTTSLLIVGGIGILAVAILGGKKK
jgi:hypothetical protein